MGQIKFSENRSVALAETDQSAGAVLAGGNYHSRRGYGLRPNARRRAQSQFVARNWLYELR